MNWRKCWKDFVKREYKTYDFKKNKVVPGKQRLELYAASGDGHCMMKTVMLVEKQKGLFLEFNSYKTGKKKLIKRFKVEIMDVKK